MANTTTDKNTDKLDALGLSHYDERIKAFITTMMNQAVTSAIAQLAGALKFKGLISSTTTMHSTYPDAKVGDVYFVSGSDVQLTYFDAEGNTVSGEVMENGDAVVCIAIDDDSDDEINTYPRWGTLNVNWQVSANNPTLSWGGTSTIGSVGGTSLKVKMPAKSSISPSDIGAATAAQGALAEQAYKKPSTGIPLSDLESGVKTSLGKADTAVQPDDLGSAAEKEVVSDVNDVYSGADGVPSAGLLYDYAVKKVSGKGLSTNDYTNADKAKVDALGYAAYRNLADNNSDFTDAESSPEAAALVPTVGGILNYADNKLVKQVSGKGLSTNDYTTAEKNKLAGIQTGANVADVAWDATNLKLTKTINGTTSDVVTAAALKTALGIDAPLVYKGTIGGGSTTINLQTNTTYNKALVGFTYVSNGGKFTYRDKDNATKTAVTVPDGSLIICVLAGTVGSVATTIRWHVVHDYASWIATAMNTTAANRSNEKILTEKAVSDYVEGKPFVKATTNSISTATNLSNTYSTAVPGDIVRVAENINTHIVVTFANYSTGVNADVEANAGDVFVCLSKGGGAPFPVPTWLHISGGGRISDSFIDSLFD